jgi:hypothetical protein
MEIASYGNVVMCLTLFGGWFVFISDITLADPAEVPCGFPRFLKENSWIVS